MDTMESMVGDLDAGIADTWWGTHTWWRARIQFGAHIVWTHIVAGWPGCMWAPHYVCGLPTHLAWVLHSVSVNQVHIRYQVQADASRRLKNVTQRNQTCGTSQGGHKSMLSLPGDKSILPSVIRSILASIYVQ